MRNFQGKTLSWKIESGVLELALHREPCNEIGLETLQELEVFAEALKEAQSDASVAVIYSTLASGFCAGADLRETYRLTQGLPRQEKIAGVRDFITRIHAVFNTIDASPLVTIAAVDGVCFGGGLELALVCDLIVADRMARFCFPELRLGLIPGFGGIPRLKRDLGNAVVRDLLFTGRSLNATKAQAVGLVSQVAAEGEALRLARSTAEQIKKFDPNTRAAAKKFLKPIPEQELRQEIEIFCELFTQPAVEAGLRKFVESTEALPYLP
ncbi:MAG: enoyl-CoA hydratase/isomerase family protein [Acidobacteria bacterium]|nr:enoyl-CoA hydratase/isomerase family protein [Acidobacteriota bacterium]